MEQSIKAERGPEGWMPQFFWTMTYDAPAAMIASRLQATGPNFAIASACVSGAKAVERATRWLRRGHAEIIIAGGSESVIDQHGVRVLHAMHALTAHSHIPEHASRPFDKNRAGFVLAEGAGMLVLETLDHARQRDAPILAEVVGVGGSANAFSLYAPEPVGEGPAAAMDAALNDARMDYHDVDLIVAHATSTGIGDPAEAEGFRMTFKEAVGAIAITAPKSMMGHAIGAAGALGAVHCVQAIQHGVIPPTMNLDDPEEFIAGLDVIRDEAREQPVRIALNNAFGFGGANGSNIFVRFDG